MLAIHLYTEVGNIVTVYKKSHSRESDLPELPQAKVVKVSGESQ
jgi:hypothetical protein